MSRRSVFFLAALSAVLLAGRGAFAERLGGSYRGPEDQKTAEKDSGSSSGTDSGSGSNSTGSSGGSTTTGGGGSDSGTGAGGGGGSDSGAGGSSSGGSGGGDSGGSGSSGGSSGPDAGGSSGDGGHATSSGGGSTGGGGGGDSGGSSGGSSSGGGGGGGGKKAASQDQFYVASWYFEHNRERLLHQFGQSQTRRLQIPARSTARIFSVLPADTRKRSDITAEDKDKIFNILKHDVLISDAAVVRDAAVMSLGKLGTPAAVELLKSHLQTERDLQVRQDTLVALGMTRLPEAVPVLLEAVKAERKAQLTSFALLGLGLSGDERAGPVVLETFANAIKKPSMDNATADIVASAAVALGSLAEVDAVKPLAQALNNKAIPEVVRCACAQALGRFGTKTFDDKGAAHEVAKKALEEALGKGGLEVERAAAIALGSFPDKKVVEVLLGKEGLGKPDPLASGFSALSVSRILGQMADEDVRGADELRKVATTPEKSNVRAEYANLGLAMCGGLDADVRKWYETSLAKTTLDKDVQSSLAMASGLAGVVRVQSILAEMASDNGRNVNTRAYAAMAYGMVSQAQPAVASAKLKEIYKTTEDANVRRGLILGLGFVGDRSDVKFLIDVIDTTKEDLQNARYTRGAAVIALGMIRDGESIAAIQTLMQRNDPRTRAYALAALGCLAARTDDVSPVTRLFENANFRKEFATLEAVMHQL